jgi:ethanolamine ammonia-lyase large subunit
MHRNSVVLGRRSFLRAVTGGVALAACPAASSLAAEEGNPAQAALPPGVSVAGVEPGEDLFAYLQRRYGRFVADEYKRLLGAANEFKEGDQIVGVAAADDRSRQHARQLLSSTRLSDVDAHPLLQDDLFRLLEDARDPAARRLTASWTLGQLRDFLLTQSEAQIHAVMPGLSSEAIGCVVKLMSNEQLIQIGSKVFNPLPGSQLGERGYLGARIQPNSPTDNLDDIRWQVFDGWAYAVGDVVLGTNPVSSEAESVEAIQLALQELLTTFGLTEVLPHCVLSHIDVQAEVEAARPGSTALWFQSIAGSDSANQTFDVSIDKMLRYARTRTGKYGFYFETGQGADFTNGHGHGFDMVLHESRKYGFARALTQHVAEAQRRAGQPVAPWIHVNDVAGFIGPEVFRTREQLVRCCLEDIVMGKLHGLTIGLDVCSTLHMDVTLDDLDWCLEQVMPANPAYLMALPTKIDPMLGYLTTGYQDHVRLREQYGYRVNDRMWQFFQELGVIDQSGNPTEHFGDPLWVYLQYQKRHGDPRPDQEIVQEGRAQMQEVRARGVFLAQGYGARRGDLEPSLDMAIRRIYDDAKQCIWTELEPSFVAGIPDHVELATRSQDRNEYILRPETGEQLSARSLHALQRLREQQAGRFDAQIVISDGLNALAISDPDQLEPFLRELRERLAQQGFRTAPEHLVIRSGRVRAGYRIGETLFSDLPGRRVLLHVVGERPGTGHRTFSVYITSVPGAVWSQAGRVDHNVTKVVSGIATTALPPVIGAASTARILATLG